MIIRSLCAMCAQYVELPSSEVTLIYRDDRMEYIYDCPKCFLTSVKLADRKIERLLRIAEVRIQSKTTVPARSDLPIPDLPPAPEKPLFTWDDLLDFHEELERDEWQWFE